MARAVKRLSARSVATATKPGRHADGEGLYLVVDASGAKRWLFLFRWQGKLKEMGLGGLSTVPLADARERASDAYPIYSDLAPDSAARTERYPTRLEAIALLETTVEPEGRPGTSLLQT